MAEDANLISSARLARIMRAVERVERQTFTGNVEVRGDAVRVLGGPPDKPTGKDKSPGLFPLLVKWIAGSDGTGTTMATWAYDIYQLTDTTYTTKLNAAPLQPTRSAARTQFGKITKAPDGTEGMCYLGSTGAIKLWDCQEIRASADVCDS